MTSTEPPAGHTPTPWRSSVRRGWLPVLLGVLGGLVIAAAMLSVLPKKYTAAAKVQVKDTGVAATSNATNGRTSSDINLDTEAQLVTSAQVIAAARRLDPSLPATTNKLISRIAVTVPANTTVMQIAYTDRNPTLAQDGANAFANAYLANRRNTAQRLLTAQLDSAHADVSSLTKQLKSLVTTLSKLPSGSPEKQVVNSQITQTNSQITLVNQNIVDLDGVQITPGLVTNPANSPNHPSSPSKTIYLASGFAVGLLIGLLLAWLRIRFRRVVRTVDDLSQVVDAPCIAVFRRPDPNAVGALAAYRHLTVVVSTVLQPPARIVVTSPFVESECSHVAAGLAAALTRRGATAAVLQVHGDEVDAPHVGAVPTSRVLDADDVMVAEDRSLPAALERIRGDRAVLIVDAPGATVTTDAQVMGAEADAVLVVVVTGTRSSRVRQTIAGLDSVGAPILGTVLVHALEGAAPAGRAERRPSRWMPRVLQSEPNEDLFWPDADADGTRDRDLPDDAPVAEQTSRSRAAR